MKILKILWAVYLPFLFAFMISCTQEKKETTSAEGAVQKAICVLYPTNGNSVKGVVTFTKTETGVNVIAYLEGLTPGNHGFHIHEYGDCSAADASSAGGHFNPEGAPHAGPMDPMRHKGDMGNIVADSLGHAHLDFTDDHLALGGINSIVGKSLVVHKDTDDLKSQPSGNAGPRIACGVIGLGK